MISNPRAGRRLGEKRLLAASLGQAAAYLPAISSSPAASPSRASTAARPTQSGPARASERQGGRGRASRAVCALPTSQEVPGNIPSGPPLPASPAAAAAAKSGQAPGRCSPLSAALPGQGSCRLLLLLLLLLAESGLGEKPGPPPPRRAWRAGAARAGLRGREDTGGALPAGAPGPRQRPPDTKEQPAQGPAEYKLINNAQAWELLIANPPAASLFNSKGCNQSQGKGGGAVRPPLPKDWGKKR